jgi:UDP-2,4-diacetamido-2,4,6-trideoxy-beta-L-altropyranose hydrolase
MASADLAIGAGGTTSWERACLGLPAIVTAVADNQRDTVLSLVDAGAAISIEAGDQYQSRLQQAIATLASSREQLAAMSAAAAGLVDGKGADRIAAILMRPDITLRPATAEDSRDFWRWRNEPDVRQASNNSAPIGWGEHRAWFESALANPDRHLLIGESDDAAVGVLRFDVAGDEATVSIYLTPQGRGRGVGPELLMRGQAWLQSNLPQIARIRAQIRPGNAASIAAFEAARYRRQGENYVREVPHEPA